MTLRALRVQGPRLRLPANPGRPVAAARRRVRAAADPVAEAATAVLPAIEAGAARGRAVRAEPGAAAARPVVRRVPDPVRAALPRPAPLPVPRPLPGVGRAVVPAAFQPGGRAVGERPGGVNRSGQAGLGQARLGQAGPGIAIRATQRAGGAVPVPAHTVRLAEMVAPRLLVPDLPGPPGPVAAAARPVAVLLPAPGPVLAGLAALDVVMPRRASPAPISPVRAGARPVAPRAARFLPPGAEVAERDGSAPEGQAPSPQSGTVLLDGQLVGQWLMERMARDAERPPAGLTGFDVRQAPGWSLG